MNSTNSAYALIFVLLFGIGIFGQQTAVINDPTLPYKESKISETDKDLIDREVWPVVRKKYEGEMCTPEFEYSEAVQGSFTKPKVSQKLIYFQVCQTGNGFGIAGLALIEDGKVTGIYGADEAGWVAGARALPDINQNGVDEIAIHYSGGMHQGAGGTGVDMLEFRGNVVRGLGWFQAEGFSEDAPTFGYKVTVKKGKVPVFYRQKLLSGARGWKPSGKLITFRPSKNIGTFTAVR